MKKITVLLAFILLASPLYAQKNLLPKFLRRMILEKDSSKRSSLFPLPVLGSAPETGVEVGASVLYSFYTDTLHNDTRVSNIFGYATVTTKGQSRFSLSTSYWTPHNDIHYTVAVSYINFPFDFYGIGPTTYKSQKDHLDQKRFKFNAEADKKLGKYIFVGLSVGSYDYRINNETPGGIFDSNPNIEGRSGGAGVFISPVFMFDTRNNNTYTTKGVFVTSYYNVMQGVFGNNGYQGGFLNVEVSQYNALNKHFMLGFDVQSQNLTGGQSPFYLMPQLGSDEMMRGYYGGRYRDRNFIAGQAELRYRLSDRWALAYFIGAGTVSSTPLVFTNLKPSSGGGLRYFFDVEKGLTIRADYGIGEQVHGEQRQSGFYLSMGEAF